MTVDDVVDSTKYSTCVPVTVVDTSATEMVPNTTETDCIYQQEVNKA